MRVRAVPVFHARHHFLSDKAALLEAHPTQLVEIGLMRKSSPEPISPSLSAMPIAACRVIAIARWQLALFGIDAPAQERPARIA